MPSKLNFVTTFIMGFVSVAANSAVAASDLDPVQYDKLFPQYAELCAGSQYRDQVDGNGGPNGHGVLFLKGACRDMSAEYPQLKVCDNGPGVGISTYFAFKNVLWVATEGREFFLRGGLDPKSPVTQKEIDQVIKSAQKQGILKNVEMHDWIMKGQNDNKWKTLFGAQEDSEHYKYRMSLGTDWALGLARNMYCSRIPMTKNMVAKAVAHLNEENRKAFHREKGYENGYIWDVALNNCMHTAYNALAAAGMWAPKQIKANKMQVILSKFTDGNLSLAVPFDTFLRVAKAGAEKSMVEPRAMATNGPIMNSIINENWILQQPGTMLVMYPIHKNNNVFFNADSPHAFVKDQIRSALDLTPLPIIRRDTSEKLLNSLYADKANTDLSTNLQFSLKRIENAIEREQYSRNDTEGQLETNQSWVQSFTQFMVNQSVKAKNLILKNSQTTTTNSSGTLGSVKNDLF